jgi:hypothetical protein
MGLQPTVWASSEKVRPFMDFALRIVSAISGSMAMSLRSKSFAAVLEHVGEGLFNSMKRLPAGIRPKLACVGNQERLIDGAHSRGVDPDLNRSVAQGDKVAQGVGKLCSSTGSKIIDLAWSSVLGKEAIAADDIANICEVANDLEIANLDVGFAPSFNLGDLVCEGCENIGRRLSGAGMVERPNHDHVRAMSEMVLDAQKVGRSLAGRVGVVRSQRAVFLDRQMLWVGIAVADP